MVMASWDKSASTRGNTALMYCFDIIVLNTVFNQQSGFSNQNAKDGQVVKIDKWWRKIGLGQWYTEKACLICSIQLQSIVALWKKCEPCVPGLPTLQGKGEVQIFCVWSMLIFKWRNVYRRGETWASLNLRTENSVTSNEDYE